MSDAVQFLTLVALMALGLAAVGTLLYRRAQSRTVELQRRFGPEYLRTIEALGSVSRAEAELEQRARRVEHFRFQELDSGERRRLTHAWNDIQAKFATDPAVAVTASNELINEVMRARGYPTLSFEQRVADLSVHHPLVVQHYRAAHQLARSVYNGVVDTELLRQALVHYRMLFTELLHEERRGVISAPPPPLRQLPVPPSLSRVDSVH